MNWFRITYYLQPFLEDFTLEVLAKSKEAAIKKFIDLKPQAEIIKVE